MLLYIYIYIIYGIILNFLSKDHFIDTKSFYHIIFQTVDLVAMKGFRLWPECYS